MKSDARLLAYKIINQFNSDKKLELIFDDIFFTCKPDARSRSRTQVLVKEVIRLKGRLDLMIEYVSGKKLKQIQRPIISILRIGFYEIIIDDSIPDYAAVNSAVNLTNKILNHKAAGFTNVILRKLTYKKNNEKGWINNLRNNPDWNSIPLWIQNRWKESLGEYNQKKMIESINMNPANFIRVQEGVRSIKEIKKILLEDGIESEIFSELFLKISCGTGKILKTNLFNSGEISIQNPASAAIVECLDIKNGDTVLDVCAAPGTKSLYLSSLVGITGTILASDINEERVEIGKDDIKRHRKSNIKWMVKDASKDDFPNTNRILIDAPCTGTGVIGRKPDIRWRRKISDIYEMSKKQFEILSHCSKFLNPNGIIVYATCSIEPEENWNVVEQFIKLNPQFFVDKINSKVPSSWIDNKGALCTLPYLHNVDGMFAVKIKRSL
ncbi:MAG: transcription antitermination factor NusB [Candidatus Neomarinimicrobiota bacterium]